MVNIDKAKELLDTMQFDEFCNKVNSSFNAISCMMELIKSNNEDVINIIENGRK